MAAEPGLWIKYAKGIKDEIGNVPVIAVRRIMSPILAEKILRLTDIDLICFARSFLADPHFPNKAKEGRFEDIVPCIACNQGCYDYVAHSKPITCLMNPAVGKEKKYQVKPTKKKRGK